MITTTSTSTTTGDFRGWKGLVRRCSYVTLLCHRRFLAFKEHESSFNQYELPSRSLGVKLYFTDLTHAGTAKTCAARLPFRARIAPT
jgi:hypothetical protein